MLSIILGDVQIWPLLLQSPTLLKYFSLKLPTFIDVRRKASKRLLPVHSRNMCMNIQAGTPLVLHRISICTCVAGFSEGHPDTLYVQALLRSAYGSLLICYIINKVTTHIIS